MIFGSYGGGKEHTIVIFIASELELSLSREPKAAYCACAAATLDARSVFGSLTSKASSIFSPFHLVVVAAVVGLGPGPGRFVHYALQNNNNH